MTPPDPPRRTPLFPRRATAIGRAVPAGIVLLLVAVPVAAMIWVRTPVARGEGRSIRQPVPFDHAVHVTGLHIDCRYCHSGADRTAMAGVPTTQGCVACHSSTWMATREFAPVRRSLASGEPIPWRRVTQLPDFVYFNHAMHVTRGVGCEVCHGRVDRMAVVSQAVPLTMKWCVDCHRNPEPYLRPPEAVTVMGWHSPPGDSAALAAAILHVRHLTNCSTCHR
jgi:hypothetical protein